MLTAACGYLTPSRSIWYDMVEFSPEKQWLASVWRVHCAIAVLRPTEGEQRL
jgi:hypothetical protein